MKLREIGSTENAWEEFVYKYDVSGIDQHYGGHLTSGEIVGRLNTGYSLTETQIVMDGHDEVIEFPSRIPRLFALKMTTCRLNEYSKMPIVDEFRALLCNLGPGIVQYAKSHIKDLLRLSNSKIRLNDLCLIIESGPLEVSYFISDSDRGINLTINKYDVLEISVRDNKSNSIKRIVVKSVFDLQDTLMQMQLDDERYFVQ
ncbi:hypothetical protein RsoM2USA_278 [Ralstonia phage RsoM2USA]|nr:hypothetical protein RsoM2USA_278 [Ralstonia phage RsoM2USA]